MTETMFSRSPRKNYLGIAALKDQWLDFFPNLNSVTNPSRKSSRCSISTEKEEKWVPSRNIAFDMESSSPVSNRRQWDPVRSGAMTSNSARYLLHFYGFPVIGPWHRKQLWTSATVANYIRYPYSVCVKRGQADKRHLRNANPIFSWKKCTFQTDSKWWI